MTTSNNSTNQQGHSGEKHYDTNSKVIGKLLIKGTLKACSPIIIGSGLSDLADIEVLKEPYTETPYIPGSSMAGVIRHALEERLDANKLDCLFGSNSNGNTRMSQIYFSDAYANNEAKIRIRDSVRINNKTATAELKGKFDYEIVEVGACFPLDFEVTLREGSDNTFFKNIIFHIVNLLENEEIRIGAKTNSGFGRLSLAKQSFLLLDFKNPQHVRTWLLKENKEDYGEWKKDFDSLKTEDNFLTEIKSDFVFDGLFRIDNSLLISSSNTLEKYEDTDAAMIMGHNASGDESPVVPGTSLRGAIRHHAEKIFNTFHPDHIQQFRELFGFVESKDSKNSSSKTLQKFKSRIRVEEHFVDNPLFKLQMRNRIDRFTGGTVETSLFDSVSIWGNAKATVHVSFRGRKIKDWEAGLLLLIIKDMWNGFIAIGGENSVGRGILSGYKGNISFNGRSIEISAGDTGMNLNETVKSDNKESKSAKQFLDDLVKKFRKPFNKEDDHGE